MPLALCLLLLCAAFSVTCLCRCAAADSPWWEASDLDTALYMQHHAQKPVLLVMAREGHTALQAFGPFLQASCRLVDMLAAGVCQQGSPPAPTAG